MGTVDHSYNFVILCETCMQLMCHAFKAPEILAESVDGLLLATVHVYSPGNLPVSVRVWVYCAVTRSFNTVSVPSVMTVVESRVQVTVVEGPPVEIQVRVN